jgi:hypothetical protein
VWIVIVCARMGCCRHRLLRMSCVSAASHALASQSTDPLTYPPTHIRPVQTQTHITLRTKTNTRKKHTHTHTPTRTHRAVTEENLDKYVGKRVFTSDRLYDGPPPPGVVMGAWWRFLSVL